MFCNSDFVLLLLALVNAFETVQVNLRNKHCVKSVRIRSFSGLCSVQIGKIRTRKTPYILGSASCRLLRKDLHLVLNDPHFNNSACTFCVSLRFNLDFHISLVYYAALCCISLLLYAWYIFYFAVSVLSHLFALTHFRLMFPFHNPLIEKSIGLTLVNKEQNIEVQV